MAGRKPKPTALKKLEGNPGKRKMNTKEPVPGKGMLWKMLRLRMKQLGMILPGVEQKSLEKIIR